MFSFQRAFALWLSALRTVLVSEQAVGSHPYRAESQFSSGCVVPYGSRTFFGAKLGAEPPTQHRAAGMLRGLSQSTAGDCAELRNAGVAFFFLSFSLFFLFFFPFFLTKRKKRSAWSICRFLKPFSPCSSHPWKSLWGVKLTSLPCSRALPRNGDLALWALLAEKNFFSLFFVLFWRQCPSSTFQLLSSSTFHTFQTQRFPCNFSNKQFILEIAPQPQGTAICATGFY